MLAQTKSPAIIVVTLSIDELRSHVREAVREVLAEQTHPAPASPLVNRHELARVLGVSVATVTRMTHEGLPHVFAGASPRYTVDEARAWLLQRGRKGTKASVRPPMAPLDGVRLLSRERP
jgi:hypothetical protein